MYVQFVSQLPVSGTNFLLRHCFLHLIVTVDIGVLPKELFVLVLVLVFHVVWSTEDW